MRILVSSLLTLLVVGSFPLVAHAADDDKATKKSDKAKADKDDDEEDSDTAAASTKKSKKAADDAPMTTSGGASLPNDNDWKFDFHGYLRAPMQLGFLPKDNTRVLAANNNAGSQLGGMFIHTPRIPDNQYLNWQYTKTGEKDWAELFFIYGNSVAKGVIGFQAYGFTDSSFVQSGFDAGYDPQPQLGISQAYVDITPTMQTLDNVRMNLKVGSFWNRFGMAGKYDAGKYDTFLFGRTHTSGFELTTDIDMEGFSLKIPIGFGANLPVPSTYADTMQGLTLVFNVNPAIELHSGAQNIKVQAHFIDVFTNDELIDPNYWNDHEQTHNGYDPKFGNMMIAGLDARLELGPIGEFYLGFSDIAASNAAPLSPAVEVIHSQGGQYFGMGFVDQYLNHRGCYVTAEAAYGVNGDPAPEGAFANRGSNGIFKNTAMSPAPCGQSGNVLNFAFQYDFSLGNFMLNQKKPGAQFWGDGPEFKLSLFAMVNYIMSATEGASAAADSAVGVGTGLTSDPVQYIDHKGNLVKVQGTTKWKLGAEAVYTPLSWFGGALRFDQVSPSKDSSESFQIVAPRLIFRTQFVTHEEITLQWAHYFYGANPQPPNSAASPYSFGGRLTPLNGGYPDYSGNGCTDASNPNCYQSPLGYDARLSTPSYVGQNYLKPDADVIKVAATMWF